MTSHRELYGPNNERFIPAHGVIDRVYLRVRIRLFSIHYVAMSRHSESWV